MKKARIEKSSLSLDSEGDGATPLSPDEKAGLIPSWVTFRRELNEVEQANIAKGLLWAMRQEKRRRALLDEEFARELHRRMFGEVWSWAGTFRATERNIGIAPWQISMAVRNLIDDALAWIEHRSYEPDEIAVRFHHRLVFVHPFPNGNGRHSRLIADLLAIRLGRPVFSWGGGELTAVSNLRARYIDALRLADAGDLWALLDFARSGKSSE